MDIKVPAELLNEVLSGLKAYGKEAASSTIDKLIKIVGASRIPCPFCGCEFTHYSETTQRGIGVIVCDMCRSTGPESSLGEKGATLSWNSRKWSEV